MKTMKVMAIVLGSTLFIGGCVGDLLSNAITQVPIAMLSELLIDADGGLGLWDINTGLGVLGL